MGHVEVNLCADSGGMSAVPRGLCLLLGSHPSSDLGLAFGSRIPQQGAAGI